jgi:hypothetical protein
MKVWVDEIAKWVVAEPLPPVEYGMDEGALEALLARPLAPENPGRWVARGALWVKREPLPALEYRMDEAERAALLERATAPRNPGRWIDRARNRDAGKPL